MTEKTKRIIATIAAEHGITPEEVEHEMMEGKRHSHHQSAGG